MKMYDRYDMENIVEKFLAFHFGFEYLGLNMNSKLELKSICEDYGIEVDNIVSQRNV